MPAIRTDSILTEYAVSSERSNVSYSSSAIHVLHSKMQLHLQISPKNFQNYTLTMFADTDDVNSTQLSNSMPL